jgi:plasmid stability protein
MLVRESGKIVVRGIAPELWDGLVAVAAEHDRPVEAEARHALRAWVAPFLQRAERSARRVVLAARLRELLDQINSVLPVRVLRPSHIAQKIGEAYAEPIENGFTGEIELSFAQLEAIAKYLGAVPEWLLHGDGHPFPTDHFRPSENAAEFTTQLLDLDQSERVTALHFVRCADQTGALMIVKQYGPWRCKTQMTPIHVSEEIGSGGEAALTALSVSLEHLYRHYEKNGPIIKSYLARPETFRALLDGKVHPIALIRDARSSCWWEDFWDTNRFDRVEHWPGWKTICNRIAANVDSRPNLKAQMETSSSGQARPAPRSP